MHGRNWLVSALILGAGILIQAQQAPKIKYVAPENVSAADGPLMFQTYCSPCHGTEGMGNGPAAAALRKQPPDLTQLSRQNQGKFPRFRVSNVISGAGGAHGSREMPMWGSVFHSLGNATVKLRIDNLTKYIETIQRQ